MQSTKNQQGNKRKTRDVRQKKKTKTKNGWLMAPESGQEDAAPANCYLLQKTFHLLKDWVGFEPLQAAV